MYTQCPDCSTVFRVTAEALRMAQGRVRCGICSAGFDALENLSESPVARALEEPSHDDTITVEELPGTEFIELSSGAQSGGDETDGPTADGESRTEEASMEEYSVDEGTAEPGKAEDDEGEASAVEGDEKPLADPLEALPDTALEFHGSAEDLERLFVPAAARETGTATPEAGLPEAIEEVASRDLSGIEVTEEDLSWPDDAGTSFDPANPAHVAAVLASSSGEATQGKDTDLDRTDEYPVLVIEEYEQSAQPDAGPDVESPAAADEMPEEAPPDASVPSEEREEAAEAEAEPDATTDAADVSTGETGAPLAGDEEDTSAGSGRTDASDSDDGVPLLIIPEELRRGPSATAADDLEAPLDLEEETPPRWPLVLAALLLAAVLGAQAVHHWRHELVRSPAAGPWMLRTYHALGLELRPPVDLAGFELRQLGAASDPGQAGRIRVRASIVNHAPFAQPYPLLRLTLQDRFGSTIGARNLAPAEYLPGAAVDASGLLGASQRADAEVVFVDPGREAVGFELDVCVEAETGLRCSADLPRGAP